METWITNGVAKVSTGSIKEANKEEVYHLATRIAYNKTIGHYSNVQG